MNANTINANDTKNHAALLSSWFEKLDKIGVNPDNSTSRLGYTIDEDKMIECVINIGKEFGLKHYYDEVGNAYIYNGDNKGDYTLIGSHVDSVVSGGKYDGVVGVLGGLLILKWIEENKLNIPVKVGIFRMEESSVFGMATVGSSLVTGKLNEASLKQIKNGEGVSLYDLLKSKGYNPTPPMITNIKQYLEVHIEQGRVLEEKNVSIGIVNAIAAPTRNWIKITGRQDHSGATPMGMRKDALVAAAELIVAIENLAENESHNASVATVGIVRNSPNAFNVIPGEVTIGVDIRGINKASIDKVVKHTVYKTAEICKRRELTYEIIGISASDPVSLSNDMVISLEKSANELNIPTLVMPSGAGHDAMKFVDICPVGMLFIPCKEGISHNKEEHAELTDIVTACRIIYKYLNS